jgi:3-hydroxybutyryl-CoA dehydrogenase
MKIVVITNEALKQELLAQGLKDGIRPEWLVEPAIVKGADCYIDLLFQPTAERINILQKPEPALIIVNSVIATLENLPGNFIRFNGWPTFLKRSVAEAVYATAKHKETAEKIFTAFSKTTEWVPDVPGFISARIVSMIINEAYFTLDEKVSSKNEIDTAMKLGTNYPFGPFEWGEKIGLRNVYELLIALAKTNSRYEPAALLKKEAQ